MSGLVRFTLACAAAMSIAAAPMPRAARKVDVVDHLFGLDLPDPYRWMEGVNNAEFQTWLKAQGEYTRAQLDSAPALEPWQKRLSAASGATSINRLQREVAGRIFFLRLEGGHQGVLMVRDVNGKERALLDPNMMVGDQPASITEYSVSPDGKLVGVNVDRGGNEITRVQILDVETGTARADAFERVWGEFPVSWLADSSGMVYNQLAPLGEAPPSDPLQNSRSRFHKLGQPVADDPIILGRGINSRVPFVPEEFSLVQAGANSNWALMVIGTARAEARACYAPKGRSFHGASAMAMPRDLRTHCARCGPVRQHALSAVYEGHAQRTGPGA